ncbi:MAG: phosphoribosyltransferase [Candidatus Cloacimonetes bacterium]|jgi:hypoxanthine phosphoribosyltransferase|nr:phosphoribosyltransferase [Candidatus Cloacimonadota bacterium]MBT4332127.1 phosphoribosyltransferase [Candidatus Cloacimonadota bacterium]MBT4575250.1 phosphoribosyltransferase [Candidatus Cloacimonadota bacterium]MBT5420445.1 phosphoribosyltransferase [Candidatus Cloacimonadota bacterium]
MNSVIWDKYIHLLNEIQFEDFDFIVAIGNGGIIPAAFIQKKLNIPMKIIKINYRDPSHKPKYDDAVLLEEKDFPIKNKKILLVDDVSRTGKTLKKAKEYLNGNTIKTFTINGEGDYSFYNQEECLLMPWTSISHN